MVLSSFALFLFPFCIFLIIPYDDTYTNIVCRVCNPVVDIDGREGNNGWKFLEFYVEYLVVVQMKEYYDKKVEHTLLQLTKLILLHYFFVFFIKRNNRRIVKVVAFAFKSNIYITNHNI